MILSLSADLVLLNDNFSRSRFERTMNAMTMLTKKINQQQKRHICSKYCFRIVYKMGHWAQRRFDKKQELGNKQTWLTSDPPSQINCFHVTLCWVVRTRPKWKCLQLGRCVLLLLHPFTNPKITSFLSSKYITYCAMQTQDTWYWNSMSKECILHRKMTAVLKLPWALNLACVVIHAKGLPGSVLSIDCL